MNDTIEGTYIETTPATLAVREEAPPVAPSLFGSDDPVAIVERAVRVADALKAVVVSKNLISHIQGKAYPQVEAWLTLAAMLRLTTICEWSRRVENGWEARVYVRNAAGETVGAAEAQCLGTERSKKSWEDYALRSMSQTRATSKALRSVLGFVMVLAGYQATPAEEMPGDETPPASPTSSAPTLVALRQIALDRRVIVDPNEFGGWCRAKVAACAGLKPGDKPSEAQRAAIAATLDALPADGGQPEPPAPTPPAEARETAKDGASEQPMSAGQRSRFFALFNARVDGLRAEYPGAESDEALRHLFAARVLGDPAKASIKTWTTADAKRVMDRLELLPPDKVPA